MADDMYSVVFEWVVILLKLISNPRNEASLIDQLHVGLDDFSKLLGNRMSTLPSFHGQSICRSRQVYTG